MIDGSTSADVLRRTHTPDAIRRRLESGPAHNYLRDFVYGAIDGAVTTFAVVSGVAGAGLAPGIVIVLGVANLLGDGFSMAAGNFLGTRADEQLLDRARLTEEYEIDLHPDGEREEIRQIIAAKGFAGDDLERAVEIITSDRRRWVETMLTEELGLSLDGPSAVKAAAMTFAAFVCIGLIPLASFLINLAAPGTLAQPFLWSALLTAAAFVSVGAVKARFVEQHWVWAGIETLFVGGSAAALAYVVGAMLKGIAS